MQCDCQTISRAIFLIFIILAAAYFIFVNKSESITIERFEGSKIPDKYDPKGILQAAEKDTNILLIKDLYQSNFSKPPSQKEIEFYLDYLQTRKLAVADLNDLISGSNSALEKTFYSTNSSTASSTSTSKSPSTSPSASVNANQYNAKEPVIGTEEDVISAFNEILSRNPDNSELLYYAKKMKNEKEFTIQKLKDLLIASDEYYRLDKTQNNKAFSGTLGNITDRQLTLVISTIYKEETKEEISNETLMFLKKQYKDFNLNDDTLRKYIKQFSTFEKDFESGIKNAASTGISGIKNASGSDILGSSLSKLASDIAKTASGSDSSKGPSTSPAAALNPSPPNAELIKQIAKLYSDMSSGDDEYLDSSKVINTLLKGNAGTVGDDEATCNGDVDKNALEKRLSAMDKQLLAKLVYDRNMDHMKNVCRRNQKYLNADQDMVLFPEFKWSVPQQFPPVCTPLEKNEYNPMVDQSSLIGTLLPDAAKTQIGSIVPKIPPH